MIAHCLKAVMYSIEIAQNYNPQYRVKKTKKKASEVFGLEPWSSEDFLCCLGFPVFNDAGLMRQMLSATVVELVLSFASVVLNLPNAATL